MLQILLDIFNYFVRVGTATFLQLIFLLGPLLLLAFIMHLVAQKTEKLGYSVLGHNLYIYGFAWLGTIVHELGHAVTAIAFGHKIVDMELFTPNSPNGTLGHVNHSFNKKSIYQRIGNFFIGIGPIFSGSLVLYLASWLLFGFSFSLLNEPEISSDHTLSFHSFWTSTINVFSNVSIYVKTIFTGEETQIWKIVLFIYLLFSVGTSVTLSKADVKSSLNGFIYFVFVLLLFNILTLWIGDFTENVFKKVGGFFSGFYFFLILSILINIVFIILLSFLPKQKATK